MIGQILTNFGSDKDTAHSYGPFYESLHPTPEARAAVRRVVELGVWTGASLLAWAEWFPNAEIIGVDVQFVVPVQHERVRLVRCDCSNEQDLEALARLIAPADLIIDDASHVLDDQFEAAQHLVPCLTPGGVYVVEDLQSEIAAAFLAGVGFRHVDLRHVKNRYDDRLAVYRREP